MPIQKPPTWQNTQDGYVVRQDGVFEKQLAAKLQPRNSKLRANEGFEARKDVKPLTHTTERNGSSSDPALTTRCSFSRACAFMV